MFKWYFYATSHCKGPCDVVGGTVKWPATKASLQRVYSFQIMTPGQVLSGQLRTFQECILNTVQLMTTKKKPSSSYRKGWRSVEISVVHKNFTVLFHSVIKCSNKDVLKLKWWKSRKDNFHFSKDEIWPDEIKGFVATVYDKD